MELWLTLILGGLIALLALFYVLVPLLSREVPPYLEEDDRLTELISRKDAVLKAIKDLEFDHQTGKVSKEDFDRFNARLRRQAIAYIEQIEKLAPAVNAVEDQIEAEIARYRRTVAAPANAPSSQPAIAKPTNGNGNSHHASSQPATEQTKHFCTECGNALSGTEKFCGQCGTPVAPKPVAVQ